MKCVVCKEDKTEKVQKVVKCLTCHHVYRDYGKINLEDYYTNKYRKGIVKNPPKDSLLLQRNHEKFNIIKNYITNTDTLLEVGFGRGHFHKQFVKKHDKEKYYCCEINTDLAKKADKQGINVIHGSFQEINTNKLFDVIASFDVLEHFEDPYVYKKKLLQILKINGLAIIQVPVERKLHSRVPFDGHYHYFSTESIKILMNDEFVCEKIVKTKPGQVAGGKEMIAIFRRTKQ